METTSLTYLTLCAPLFYSKIEDIPFEIHENEEFLLLYELNPAQSDNIEPVRELILEKLAFTGRKIQDLGSLPDTENVLTLPAGKYIFTQHRGNSSIQQEKWLDIAIEQQKDALWEQYKLKNQLYVRHLFEDNQFVIQLFRPCLAPKTLG